MFEDDLKAVLFDATEYGIFNSDIKLSGKTPALESEVESTFIDIHEGFKKAQLFIIEKLLAIQSTLGELTETLKEHRVNREKDKAQTIQKRIGDLVHQERVYRRVADSIAWQMFHAHTHYPRRLFNEREFSHSLSSSNLDHALNIVEELHKADPYCFALLSDITSFIGVGDILLRNRSGIKIIELKDGKVNQEIKEIINNEDNFGSLSNDLDDLISLINKEHGYKKAKQAERMMRQSIRMQNAAMNINRGLGVDLQTEEKYFLHNLVSSTKSFRPLLIETIKTVFGSNEDECHSFVEGCLYLGVYKGKFLERGKEIFQEVIYSMAGTSLPIIDFVESGLTDQLAQPIFILPLSRDIIVSLVLQKIKVYMAIDFDRLIELFKDTGMDAGWVSRSETERVDLNGSLFRYRNKTMFYKFKDKSKRPIIYVGGGFIQRIIYNHNLPSSVACIGFELLQQIKMYEDKIQTQHKDGVQPKVIQESDLDIDNYLGL